MKDCHAAAACAGTGAGVAIGAVAGFGATIGALTGSYFFKSEG